MKHENENSLQTAGQLAWTGAKIVYAGYAVGSLLCPRQPAPSATKAERLEAWETNEETFAKLLVERVQLYEDAKAALAVTFADEDDYVQSADYMENKTYEMIGKWDGLAHEDYLSANHRKQCKQFTQEMRDLNYVWYKINKTRKHQAFLAEEKQLVKIGAKAAWVSWHEKSVYKMNNAYATVAWAIIAVVLFGGFTALCIYGLTASGLVPW